MLTDSLFVLKTEYDLRKSSKDMSDFLQRTSKLRFWRTHFTNHNFAFEPKKFNWQYWQTIPFFTIHDLIKIGIEPRLYDAQSIMQKNIYGLVLRIPYRKMRQQHVLFLDTFIKQLTINKNEPRKIQLKKSFGLNLREVLISFHSRLHTYRLLIINSKMLDRHMKEVIDEFGADSLSADSEDLLEFLTIFFDREKRKQIKEVALTGLFMDPLQAQLVKQHSPKADFVVRHPLLGAATATRSCIYAQKRFGFDAVHPGKHTLIELINIDESGHGEVVATIMLPLELAWIRYRTGIFGKAIFEECECGSKWSLILERIRKFHYSFPVENIPS